MRRRISNAYLPGWEAEDVEPSAAPRQNERIEKQCAVFSPLDAYAGDVVYVARGGHGSTTYGWRAVGSRSALLTSKTNAVSTLLRMIDTNGPR